VGKRKGGRKGGRIKEREMEEIASLRRNWVEG
jgi:hypothetical protein